MRFIWTIGRVTLIDFTIFEIQDKEIEEEVIVLHHHAADEDDGPDNIFGGSK
jgi:hypothetical protein